MNPGGHAVGGLNVIIFGFGTDSVGVLGFGIRGSDPAATADVAAVMMQEGLANICLIGGRYARHLSSPTVPTVFWDSVSSVLETSRRGSESIRTKIHKGCRTSHRQRVCALVHVPRIPYEGLGGGRSSSITTVKARIETSIPRKRGAAIAGYDKVGLGEMHRWKGWGLGVGGWEGVSSVGFGEKDSGVRNTVWVPKNL